MGLLARMGLAALAGGAAVLGMAPFDLWPVLVLALAGVYAVLDRDHGARRPVRDAALIGWAFGFAYFGGGLYWIGEAFYVDPDTVWMMPFAVTLLPAGLALFYALAFGVARAIPRRGAAGALVLTACLCAVEFLRGFIFTGFPWNLFGSAFIGSVFDQGAALIGVYGLTFVITLLGVSLPPLVTGRGAMRFAPFAAGLVLLAGLGVFGATRDDPPPAAADVRVRIVQPDNPQTEKAEPDYVARLWRRLMDLTNAPGAEAVDIFIWPEGVTPFFLDEAPEALAIIGDVLRPGQVLLSGSARRARTKDGTRYYNALLAIDDAGQVVDTYDKAHLVPFGEYLPFPEFFRSLGIASLTARIGGAFTPGPGLRTLSVSGRPPFSALVCYEALFPAAVVAPGPRPAWLVNITDDSWFGTQTGPHQHLTAARFRAIEEGLPLARAATTGISAMIDAKGRLVAATSLQSAIVIDAVLPAGYPMTLFSRWGHAGFIILILTTLGMGLAFRRR